MIKIQGLNKYFNKGRQNEIHVINDVSLELPERGLVAIFGKSGCGKTTLLNVIGGLDGFARGTLTIEGSDIRENTDDIRNKYIGYIFQNYYLNKNEDCFGNVADALRLCGMTDEDEIERRAMAALTNVGMEKYSKRPPDTLSGGQQQRIAIARAIVKNPRIILADEPTGNLDEANTVMIMDLLKAISRDHLVLLVTHEADLVDYYCDRVIELSDGRVVSVRDNESAEGFSARDKNHIYLGELHKTAVSDANAQIEYYGDSPEAPVKLRIVNNGGKLYVEIGTAGVHILDEFSEIKLKEGVFEEKKSVNSVSEGIDMSALPPVEATTTGKLFTLKSSIKSGYEANFKKRKKSKKILRNVMCLFASVVVFMTAVFGTSIGDLLDAGDSYNHNVFYVYTPDGETSSKLLGAVRDNTAGIDYARLTGGYPYGDSSVSFRVEGFESAVYSYYNSSLRTSAVFLDMALSEELPLVAGSREGMEVQDILITTKVADALLEGATLGYMNEYSDLIGLLSNMYSVEGRNPRIAGVVESRENAVYLSELAMARYVHGFINSGSISLDADLSVELDEGETLLVIDYRFENVEYPKEGDSVTIRGKELKVVDVMECYGNYQAWLTAKGIEKMPIEAFFAEKASIAADGDKVDIEKLMETEYFTYYDYFYAEIEDYLEDNYFFETDNIEYWLYFEKGVEEVKYFFMSDEYYQANEFKELYGRYPTVEEYNENSGNLPSVYEVVKEQQYLYENEFYSGGYSYSSGGNKYVVSREDYILFSKQTGETHPSAFSRDGYYYKDYYGDIYIEEAVSMSSSIFDGYVSSDVAVDMIYTGDLIYTVVHSSDPEATEKWLTENFSDLEAPYEYYEEIITPHSIYENIVSGNMSELSANLIALLLVLVLLCICMYFIMRSSLMNRIKEVGIYRAIGVSKKNLMFKFFIEAVVLTTLTVFVGFLITSGFIAASLALSPLVAEVFFYPWWLGVAVLALLYLFSLFFGVLPIFSLLRKTPSAILAKYDI